MSDNSLLDSIHALLRIFYRFSCGIILLRSSEDFYFVSKDKVVEVMSDLAAARQQDSDLPLEKILSLEQMLKLHQQYSVKGEGAQGLPVVSVKMELLGLWNREELIQNWEKMHNARAMENFMSARRPERQPERPQPPVSETAAPPPGKSPIRISLAASPPAKTEKPGEREYGSGELAILTIEALPISMLATDTRGKELFLNKDWHDLAAREPLLDTALLVARAKELMARQALEGTLDINSSLLVQKLSGPKAVYLRPIRHWQNDREFVTIGYLFFLEGQSQGKTEDVRRQSYLGSTLPDILAEEEKRVLMWAMQEADGNQSNAAMLLGIPRQTFSYKYHKYFS